MLPLLPPREEKVSERKESFFFFSMNEGEKSGTSAGMVIGGQVITSSTRSSVNGIIRKQKKKIK